MQKQEILYSKVSFGFGKKFNKQLDSRHPCMIPSPRRVKYDIRSSFMMARIPSISKPTGRRVFEMSYTFHLRRNSFKHGKTRGMAGENQADVIDENDELCPVDCVREFKTDEELFRVLEKAKKTDSLVVVDFYRTSCGSCKYIEQGFSKLCKGSGDHEGEVIFLKHNVIDEYDEQSEVAERLRIKAVPLFHFYKNGVLMEAFPTRDKERIIASILKYASSMSLDALK